MNEIPSLDWPHVRAWAEDELKSLRSELENVSTQGDRTAVIRGEIRALKRVLDLPERVAQGPQMTPPGWPGGE